MITTFISYRKTITQKTKKKEIGAAAAADAFRIQIKIWELST